MSGALITLVACVLAQEEWAPMPGTPAPSPPPPPPVLQPVPVAPPPSASTVPPPVSTATAPEPPPIVEEAGFRFAPTQNLLVVSWGTTSRSQEQPLPSLRAGLRWAALPRPADRYQANVGVALQGGLEGTRMAGGDSRFGFGLTARGGLSVVSPRGLFFPFLDLYLLTTIAFVPMGQGVAVSPRIGAGINLNAIAIPQGGRGSLGNFRWGGGGTSGVGYVLLAVLFILLPNVEVVWVPPSNVTPASTLEARFGVGF